MKLVITGGHHSSALPVITALRNKVPNIEIFWFGHKHSVKGDSNDTLEYKEVTQLNIPFYDLHAGKLYKTFDPVRIAKVPLGVIHALFLLRKIQPDLILSFGGYLAAPTVLAGSLLGIKSVTHEQTVVAGYANKFIAKFADKVLISWPQSRVFFPAHKVVLTGIPLRKDLFEVKSTSFVSDNNLPTIYITAGKTGSHAINAVVKDCLSELLNFANIIHQTGDVSTFNDFDDLSGIYSDLREKVPGDYFLRRFVYSDEIGEAFTRASLIVSRSGAHITSEILATEKPSLLIPIPWVSHNEQFENARVIANSGLGLILEESNLSSDTLITSLKKMLLGLGSYKIKDSSFKSYIRFDASELIVDSVFPYLSK